MRRQPCRRSPATTASRRVCCSVNRAGVRGPPVRVPWPAGPTSSRWSMGTAPGLVASPTGSSQGPGTARTIGPPKSNNGGMSCRLYHRNASWRHMFERCRRGPTARRQTPNDGTETAKATIAAARRNLLARSWRADTARKRRSMSRSRCSGPEAGTSRTEFGAVLPP